MPYEKPEQPPDWIYTRRPSCGVGVACPAISPLSWSIAESETVISCEALSGAVIAISRSSYDTRFGCQPTPWNCRLTVRPPQGLNCTFGGFGRGPKGMVVGNGTLGTRRRRQRRSHR